MKTLKLSLRLLLRDWRAGELGVLAIALIIAVGSVTTVGFFTDRIQQALSTQANSLLGADLVVVSDHPMATSLAAKAAQLNLQSASTTAFPSMVLHGERNQLAEIKAVSVGYPLRGALRVSPSAFAPDGLAVGIPAAGSVWVDARLLTQLGIRVGDTVQVGALNLIIGAVLTQEPDRGGDFFSIAPRLLMNLSDLKNTELVQAGSRASYRLLLAGGDREVSTFRNWAMSQLERGQKLEGVNDARPEVRAALTHAQQYLGLAALLSVVLAAVAVALAVRRFMQRHLDSCAIMRCLGASQALILSVYLLELCWLGISASLLGVTLGYFAQYALALWLGTLVTTSLPAATLLPAGQGLLVGMALLIGFSLPILLRMRQTSTLRVLRRDFGTSQGYAWASTLLGVSVLAGLLLWKAGEFRLGLYVLAGLAAVVLVAGLLAWLLMKGVATFSGYFAPSWRYGLANIRRRAWGSVAQIIAFSLGILSLLLLTLVRGDLMESWRATLPLDAPNRFLINVQPEQLAALDVFFKGQGLATPQFFPMVRARLTAINEQPVRASNYPEDRAKRLVEREFNLSSADQLQSDNTIVAGRWWSSSAPVSAQLSLEQGIANTLGLKLHDVLTYEVAGTSFSAQITSLRKVNWDSFRVNFFVITPPGLLANYPKSYITSLYLPDNRGVVLSKLVQTFPNITIIDVAAIMAQVRAIMERVAGAVEFVFLFTLASGLMVLYAAIAATRDERIFESVMLRVLGASRAQVLKGQFAEFVLIGVLSGLIAAFGASVLSYVLSTQVLHLPYLFNPWIGLIGVSSSAAGIALAGMLGTWRLLGQPPMLALRSAA